MNHSPQPPPGTPAQAAKTRFLIIGVWNTLFGLVAFALANATVGRHAGYVASVTLMFAVAIPQAHLAQRRLVWRSRAPYFPELFRFSWVFAVAYVVNVGLLVAAVEVLGSPTLPAQVVISGLIAVSTYVIHRTWTFRHPHVPAESGKARRVSGAVDQPRAMG